MSHGERQADAPEPNAIEDQMEATRRDLASTIDQLVYRANPKTIAKREVQHVRSYFVDGGGNPRVDNIVKVAGAVAGFVAVMILLRKVAK